MPVAYPYAAAEAGAGPAGPGARSSVSMLPPSLNGPFPHSTWRRTAEPPPGSVRFESGGRALCFFFFVDWYGSGGAVLEGEGCGLL